VLDEADRMFDMGFYPDLRKLIRVVPPADRRQTMLFSATLNAWVKNLAWEYTKSPFEIEIAPETVTVDEVEQVLYHVPSEEKMRLLLGILQKEQPESAIIFCNTKRYTEIVAKRLRVNGYDCEFIIGDLPQVKRLKVIDDVKAGKIRFLVATDVAARGLDIESLAMVVNYDLPTEAENYVHRIGRTARAGKTGKAITLASEQDVYELPAIERYIGQKIPSETVTAEHLGEDKSEGQRIHTEFYEDRGERSRRGSGESRGRPRDGGGGGNREAGPGRAGSAGNRNRRRAGTSEGSGGRVRGPEAGRRTPGAGDLSRLSFNERMAVYKQKYHQAGPGAQAVEGGNRKNGGKNRPQEAGTAQAAGSGPGREANSAGTGQQGAGNNRNRSGKSRGEFRRGAGQGRPGPAGAEKEKTAPAANGGNQKAPKTGILSKILRIFNKKK
ncbi:MAG: DEAD/DEAH box helicase, partial [Treponema sp.]|jgi:ATP-dependent RNA helicase RhlB|nr:DEAD/DEAH box helicase [Treponema sp.]